MRPLTLPWLLIAAMFLSAAPLAADDLATDESWPPALPGAAANGTVTLESPEFIQVPDSVQEKMKTEGFAPFTVAKTAPKVDLAYHQDLPNRALNGTGWSSWGDILVGDNGKVYSGIGDHGKDVQGEANVFMYEYDPATKTLKQVLNGNAVGARSAGDPTFSKVHAGIQQAADGRILLICTLNDGGTAGQVSWTSNVPGSQIVAYDPETGEAEVIGVLEGRCTATTIMDEERNILYMCLEGNENEEIKRFSGFGAFDPEKKEWVYKNLDPIVHANRNIALDRAGNVYFNGKDGGLWKYDPQTKSVNPTGMVLPKEGEGDKAVQPTMRSSTAQTDDGWIYGTTMGSGGKLFRFHPEQKKVEMLGLDFMHGEYTTVSVLSPDGKYVYYLPGAHNGAMNIGTPVVQYDIATGERKVLAFLRPYIEKTLGYVPAGTYGIKLSEDGSTLYANLNGHTRDDLRPEKMPASGFGHTSFVAVHIPESER